MAELTEDTIKKVALQFLKNYYKYRPRLGQTELKLDQTGEGNIIADGHLSFQTDEDKHFLATFEATSVASKEEVLFENRFKLLIWDSIMWGSMLTAAIFTTLYIQNILTIRILALDINIVIVIGMFLFISSVCYIIFQRRSKYHYIYAIEQFKQYFADDQWIAMADDVFNDQRDPYFKELKLQCVNNGFGLFTVKNDLQPVLIIAPSRQDELKNSRQALNFDDQPKRSIRDRTMMTVKSGWQKFTSIFKKRTSLLSLDRFKKTVINQITWTIASVALISFVFIKQLLDTEHRYVTQEEWQDEVKGIGNEKEPFKALVEKQYIKPFGRRTQDYMDLNPYDDHPQVDPYIGFIESFMASDSRLFTYYDCERLYNLEDYTYIIKYDSYGEFDEAKDRVVTLTQKGIRCNLIWHGCFRGNVEGYVIFLGLLQNSEENALNEAKRLLRKLNSANEYMTELKIMRIKESGGLLN